MIKLFLIAIFAYLGYSLFLRYNGQDKIDKYRNKKSKNKYSKMDIRDAEFKDIDDSK